MKVVQGWGAALGMKVVQGVGRGPGIDAKKSSS